MLLVDILDDLGLETAASIGPSSVYRRLDVTREADWMEAVVFAESRFGKLDVLVNNAAILHLAAIENTKLAD